MLLTERIKSLAEQLNMTFASIERDTGLGRGTIRKWDTNCPSADKLLKVANLLNVSVDFLLTGRGTHSSLSKEDEEWLRLIHSLPTDVRMEIKGEMKGYLKCMGKSVAVDNSKTGTDNLGKSSPSNGTEG